MFQNLFIQIQPFLILVSWLIITYGVYKKLGKNGILLIFGVSWWFFWNFVSIVSTSGLIKPGFKVQSIILLFFYGILIGLYIKDKVLIVPLIKLKYNNFKNQKKENFLFYIIILLIFPIAIQFLFRSIYLLSTKYSQAEFRAEVFGLNTGTSELFYNSLHIASIYWLVLHPIYWLTLIIGIVSYLINDNFKILITAFLLFIMDSITTVGRFGIHYVIMTIVTLIIVSYSQKKVYKITFNRVLFIMFGLIITIILLVNIRSASDWDGTINYYLIGYHTFSFSILEVEMNNPNSILFQKTLGRSFFGGIFNFPRYISNHLLGISWIGDSDIIGGYLHQNFIVGINEKGYPWGQNAFGSIFFSIYKDGGTMGSLFFGIFFGYFASFCSKGFSSKNSLLLAIYFIIYYILVYGIFQPFTSGPILPALVLLILYYSFTDLNYPKKRNY